MTNYKYFDFTVWDRNVDVKTNVWEQGKKIAATLTDPKTVSKVAEILAQKISDVDPDIRQSIEVAVDELSNDSANDGMLDYIFSNTQPWTLWEQIKSDYIW